MGRGGRQWGEQIAANKGDSIQLTPCPACGSMTAVSTHPHAFTKTWIHAYGVPGFRWSVIPALHSKNWSLAALSAKLGSKETEMWRGWMWRGWEKNKIEKSTKLFSPTPISIKAIREIEIELRDAVMQVKLWNMAGLDQVTAMCSGTNDWNACSVKALIPCWSPSYSLMVDQVMMSQRVLSLHVRDSRFSFLLISFD